MDHDYHPVEWKTHLTNLAKVGLVIGGLWFAGVCWNTYSEATALGTQLEKVHFDSDTHHYLLN